jgi:hypothetical protein
MEPIGIVTLPLVIVLAFAAMACGLAVLRAVAENRESNRTVLVSRRTTRQEAAVIQLRRAADSLRVR